MNSYGGAIIKVKIKGFLLNKTDNTKEIFDTSGINSKNNLTYQSDGVKYKLTYSKDQVILTRETSDFNHGMIFSLNKITKTSYYLKELNTSVDIDLLTTNLVLTDNLITIHYTIVDTNTEYIFEIEMSEKK